MLYVAVATRSFRRYSTYVAATLAGIFTNSVFGVIICFVYTAVWQQNPDAGGYDVTDALTYAWIGQALIVTVAIWGGGATDEVAARIRTGDVAIDLYRPVSLLGWYLSADLGRAAYHLLTRGVAPTIVGALLFDLRAPAGPVAWLLFLVAVTLAVVVSFGLRMLVACSTFWLMDDTGVKNLAAVLAMFLSGLVVPLVLFPGWSRDLAMALPWSSFLQVPADIWLGRRAGTDALAALAFQAGWALVLLGACAAVIARARHKVVVQGG
ncbi:ABC transporter permease [Nocardioides mesophilus]|uniref:ABC transporter permease n=1 Tax=Nocardioides mesophilus TaxID=433659 RepID=UPI001FE9AEA5|nr:ABC-2 family transporter protein [Nocardioides mesophilus]